MPADIESSSGSGHGPGEGVNEPPPFLGRWRNLYLLVLGWLSVLICLFYLFTEYFK